VSKHFPNPQTKEAYHENFRRYRAFLQLPAAECEKKMRYGNINSFWTISKTISEIELFMQNQ
jgi:hypothetical protein